MAVCMATTAPWIGGRSPSSRAPSSPTRTTAEAGWPRSEGPAVKYISSSPGTRMLTLPCPLAEIAPLATTRWAMSATCSARSLSMTLPSYAFRAMVTRLPSRVYGPYTDAMPPGQVAVDGGVGLHPLFGSAADLPDDPGRDAGGQHAIGDDHARRHRGAARNQRPAADDRAVEHRGPVTHQRFLADDRAVDHAQVADGRPLPHLGHRVAAAVQHRPVLDVRAPPHEDRSEVGAQHRAVPDGRLGLDAHVPDQGGRRRDPRGGADLRLEAFELEKWHPPMMYPAARQGYSWPERQ